MRLVKRLSFSILASAVSLSLVACGGGGDDDTGDDVVDPAGTHSQYVMSEILLPTTATQANMFGLNLDGDPQNRPDNALGSILSTLAGQGNFDIQASLDAQVAEGSIVLLTDIQATDLAMASGVGLRVYLGENPSIAPCADANDMVCGNHLEGTASFEIDPASPTDALLVGSIIGGRFTGGPGTVTIQISLVEGGAPLTLDLIGARVEIGAVSATGLMSGKLGGAITQADLDNVVLPAMVDIMTTTFEDDCMGTAPACCDAGSTGETLMDLFDENDDCTVDLTELKNNSLISSLLAPDVDLLDGSGNFAPRSDNVKDSLSLGIAFTGVNGTFTRP